ncbi:hypothetical protein OPV22_014307 [Ensete ventricosum]|uniref:Uncharacterized protein n=1 Tax=Ensete ventricosum TaxID=4639 RepID=A0AAV8RBK7_ENSVE|nr:hypothetical protein OPV22_014307 [Ensete ventricosum]
MRLRSIVLRATTLPARSSMAAMKQSTKKDDEAQERSFEADDAFSAVDHVVGVKESESGNTLFDPAETTNSGVVHEGKNNRITANGTVLEKRPSSRTAPGESDKQEESGMRSRDLSKDEINV